MNNYFSKILFMLFFCAIIFIVQSSFTTNKNEIKFVQPKGFPKPFYDFSKNKITEAGFKLGRKLFYDPILSKDSSTSCNSCHLQFTGFTHVDHAFSHGIGGQTGNRNSPTLQNLAWQKFFMWDGGVTNLEMQPINPIENPIEMGSKMKIVVEKLNHSHYYKTKFYQAFGDSTITGQRLLKALSQFLVMLESINSKYDKVKHGEEKFTANEENGFKIFKKNCAACHTENLFTDGTFHNTGLNYDAELKDIGRMKITHDKNDSLKFKTPTLRNIAVSYPYMHDGRFKKLEQVIDFYTEDKSTNNLVDKILKRRIILSAQEKKDVLAFLQTLTDKEFLFDARFRDYVNE
jgi:cytochrome c peroxidase